MKKWEIEMTDVPDRLDLDSMVIGGRNTARRDIIDEQTAREALLGSQLVEKVQATLRGIPASTRARASANERSQHKVAPLQGVSGLIKGDVRE